MRPAGPISQTRFTLGVKPRHPPMRALPGDPQLLGNVGNGPTTDSYPIDEHAAAVQRETGVTVTHKDLRTGVKTAISTTPGGPPSINYLAGVSPTS